MRSRCIITVLILSLLSLTAAGLSLNRDFCDLYTGNIYQPLINALGKINDIFPFAVGEILAYIFAVSVLVFISFAIAGIFYKTTSYKKLRKNYFKAFSILILSLIFLYIMQWLIPYRSTPVNGVYEVKDEYPEEAVIAFREDILKRMEQAAAEVPRDKEGNIIYPDKEKIEAEISKTMQKLSGRYTLLKGSNPRFKKALASGLLEQMGIGGFTFPLTGEIIEGNNVRENLNYPTLVAHELCHHKGYFRENEAVFLSYIICSESDDPVIRYSGLHQAFSRAEEEIRRVNGAGRLRSLKSPSAQIEKDELYIPGETILLGYPVEGNSQTGIWGLGWDLQSGMLGEDGYSYSIKLMLEDYWA